jgi:hypothetical protein
MANNQVSSLSDADTRLAALNKEILQLETERSELLRAELANAEERVDEIEAFIGVYSASSGLSSGSKRSVKKKPSAAPKKKPGRKPRVAAKQPKAAKAATTKPARRKRQDPAERAALIKKLVKAAGKAGISARKLSKEQNMPYGAVRDVLNDGKVYSKIGEKRDRRYFLK